MKFHFFGNPSNPKILFLHAALTNYTMYFSTIDDLAKCFYVIAAEIPGHELENKTVFTSIEVHAKEIENFLIKNGHNHLRAIYGFCMGGALTVKIIDNGLISFDKILLEAAMTPYQLPKFICKLIHIRDYYSVLYFRNKKSAFDKLFIGKTWTEEVKNIFFNFVQEVNKPTIKNVFLSTNNYKLTNKTYPNIEKIEYWYGGLEKKDRAWDISYIKTLFPNIKFKVFEGMDHGEACIMNKCSYSKELKEYFNKTQ